MINAIFTNITAISIVISLIFIFQLGNLCFGIASNVIQLNNQFDKEKIKKWLLKTILTLAGTFLLCAGITLIPFAIESIGIKIPEDYSIIINFGLIVITAFGALKCEAEKCFENYQKCIENL